MNRMILAISTVMFLGVVGAAIGFSALVSFKKPTPRGVPRDTPHEEVLRINRERNRPTQQEGTKAVAEKSEFNFGMMEPNTLRQHTFVVRNEGHQTLKLGNPKSDCRCGQAELLNREIGPGETGMIAIQLEPGPEERTIDVTFKVPTNDPDNEELVFRVKGKVRHLVFSEPARITFTSGTVEQAESQHEILVFSEVWSNFTLDSISSSLDSVSWEVQAVTPEQLAEHEDAVAGYLLKVVLPEDLPSGHIEELLTFSAVPGESELEEGQEQKPVSYAIPIEGIVRGRIGFYGGGIDETGLIPLGKLKRGYEKRITLTVKVRDREPELPNLRLEAYPEFIEATLRPLNQENVDGLYVLQIVIPADAPLCSHLRADQLGHLRVISDHPRIPDKTLRLQFAILGENRSKL